MKAALPLGNVRRCRLRRPKVARISVRNGWPDASKAWAAADNLISKLTDEDIAAAQSNHPRMDSVGQPRMAELHGGQHDKLVVGPNLWSGVGLVRGGAGTALVGNPQEVAARLQEYIDLGVDSFVLSGYPHLEASIRFVEQVFPLLPGQKPVTPQATFADRRCV